MDTVVFVGWGEHQSNATDDSLESRIKQASLFSAVTGLGFFCAFLISWCISWRRSACLVDCCCGFVGCECSAGDRCCEDDEGEEDSSAALRDDPTRDEATMLLSEHQPTRAETRFASLGAPKVAPSYLFPASRRAAAAAAAGGNAHGQLGIFMLMVEFLDAIPEAAVVAIGVMEKSVEWSLVASIFMLNITSGLATFTDLIGNPSSRQSHLLFVSATVAAGMLVFSVSNDIYSRFQDEYKRGEQHSLQLATLLSGTGAGACLVVFLMWVHNSAMAARARRALYRVCCFICQRSSRASFAPAKTSGGCHGPLVSFLLLVSLMAWTVTLCVLFVLLFDLLYVKWTNEDRAAGTAFIEGLSGGAFVVTVGGTLIPFSQLGAQGITNWGRTRKAVVAALAFTSGLIAGEVLSTLV